VPLVPLPVEVESLAGEPFRVDAQSTIRVRPGDATSVLLGELVSRMLQTVGRKGPAVVAAVPPESTAGRAPPSIDLVVTTTPAGEGPQGSVDAEAYSLDVTGGGVRIASTSHAGLFRGIQTLRNLLPAFLEYEAARPRKIEIPPVRIRDRPRFGWRGAMLDVSRHFFGVADVKRFIDHMALLKLNVLHLHLADDQGWRIEIRSWPRLTAVGGRSEVGGTEGGYFTQDDYRKIVRYASDRFITVVPEIDMPGHTNAALASYAELNCDDVAPPLYIGIEVGLSALCVSKEITYRFLDDVIGEIAAITPGAWFHIGGDEVKTLSAEQYAAFIGRVARIVASKGKRLIGWDEVAAVALDPPPIVQHWRPGTSLADSARRGASFILSPGNRAYLDMQYDRQTALGLSWAGRIEVEDSYDWDPASLLPGVPASAVLGVEAPLWSETVATMMDLETLAFPRIAAIAEVAWSPQAARDWESFRARLGMQSPRWQALGINFYRSPQIPWQTSTSTLNAGTAARRAVARPSFCFPRLECSQSPSH
jgi:hexosaminidase